MIMQANDKLDITLVIDNVLRCSTKSCLANKCAHLRIYVYAQYNN